MKIVSDLYKNIRKSDYYKNQFETDENKKNILFLDPVMTSFDFYSMIVPFLSLEESGTVNTALTGLYRYSEIDTKPPTRIMQSEIEWADAIVFPMSLEGYKIIIDEIREINPDVKIIQTVEFDFYEIKNDHYLIEETEIIRILKLRNKKVNQKGKKKQRDELKAKIISRLEENYSCADRLIVLNPNLVKKLTDKNFPDVRYLPIIISPEDFNENIDFMDTLGIKNTAKMVFVSVDLNDQTKNSFLQYITIFTQLKEKHNQNFRLVIMGDNPKKHFPKFDLEYDHLKKASIIAHNKMIVKSSADFHLVLNKKNEYSTNSENIYTYVDRGMYGIPVATLNVSPLNHMIDNNHNGFIMNTRSDLIKIVDTLMKDKSALIEMSTVLKASVYKNHKLSEETLDYLGSAFFDGYEEPTETNDLDEA